MTKRKKIGVDFHIVDGKFQGSRTYLLEVYKELLALPESQQFDYYFFVEKRDSIAFGIHSFQQPNVRIIPIPKVPAFIRLLFLFPFYIQKFKLNVVHFQFNTPFIFINRTIVTIHDLLFEDHPEYFPKLFRLRLKILTPLAAKFAKRIITVSNYSKNRIHSVYNVQASKIDVALNGCNENFFYQKIEAKLLSQKFALTVGRIEKRKNHLFLFKALEKTNFFDEGYDFVVIGKRDHDYTDFHDYVQTSRYKKQVLLLEDVSEEELISYYQNANLFIYASIAEGFGLPLLEAILSGTPIISSNSTALLEILPQDYDLVFSPHNENDARHKINTYLRAPNEYKHKIQSVRKSYLGRWKDSAKTHLKAYIELLG